MDKSFLFSDTINKINYYLKSFLENTYQHPIIDNSILNTFIDLTHDYSLRPGKRLRPLLFVIAATLYKDNNPIDKFDNSIIRDSIFLELLQAFFLCHDDIIDDSDMRRDEPSLHILLNKMIKSHSVGSLYDTNHKYYTGKMFSIIAGDYLYALTYRAINSIYFKSMDICNIFYKRFNGYVLDTITGQSMDMINSYQSIDETKVSYIRNVYTLKTAKYTFECPLTLGMIYAGVNDSDELKNIQQIAIDLGIAFQIQDDIIGLFSSVEDIGKPVMSDILEGKKTLLIKYTINKLNDKERTDFLRLFHQRPLTDDNFCSIKSMIMASGALNMCIKEIEILLDNVYYLIDNLMITDDGKKMLLSLLNNIMDKYKNIN